MATLSPKGRIDLECVEAEITRLRRLWSGQVGSSPNLVVELLGAEATQELDLFDSVQLEATIRICRASRSLSEAGRMLFSASRARRSSSNDADRLRKYLARFGLDWAGICSSVN